MTRERVGRRAFLALVGGAAAFRAVAGLRSSQADCRSSGFWEPHRRPALPTRSLRSGKRLRELGYVEDRNIKIEFRWAEGNYARLPEFGDRARPIRQGRDRHPRHAGDIRRPSGPTATIPIVVAVIGDPVATGFVT